MSFSGDVSQFSCRLINQPVPVCGKGEQEPGAPAWESEATGHPAHAFPALILLLFDSSFNQPPVNCSARCLPLAGNVVFSLSFFVQLHIQGSLRGSLHPRKVLLGTGYVPGG